MSLNKLSEEELLELRKLWFEECWTQKKLSQKFNIYPNEVREYVRSFKVSDEEFLEKEAEFAEKLSNARGRKSITKILFKRRKRLIEAYVKS